MLARIFLREWIESMRDRRILVLVAALLGLSLISAAGAILSQRQAHAERQAAVASDRDIWHGQGAVNPHSAAHFGQYAFRPPAIFSAFDPGLSPWVGQAVWIEAHYRNPAEARPAEAASTVQRFGDLSPAWILQTLLPLVIILCGFGALAGERERGVLRLQLVQGGSAFSLVAGKALALLAIGALAIVVLLGSSSLPAVHGGAGTKEIALRLSGLAGAYLCYLAIWVGATLAVSALLRTARQALVVLLCAWAFSVVLLPRFAADAASAAYPIADAGAFWEAIEDAKAKGLDGHNPADVRTKMLLQRTLREHGVSSPEELPLDFAGLALQAGEESGNAIFDHFYGTIDATEDAQLAAQRAFSLGSPLIALRALSMGLAGTDLAHQRDFTRAAEMQRRDVQIRLNAEQARSGKGMNFTNTVSPEFWRTIPTFLYDAPSIAQMSKVYASDALILLAWLVLAGLMLVATTRLLEMRA